MIEYHVRSRDLGVLSWGDCPIIQLSYKCTKCHISALHIRARSSGARDHMGQGTQGPGTKPGTQQKARSGPGPAHAENMTFGEK